jgi:hypothetical protein
MKLSIKGLALASGILWGLGLFVGTWWIILLHGSSSETTFIGMIYWGYSLTPLGSVFGLVWGFFDGLIGGAIFAWLYNIFAKGK